MKEETNLYEKLNKAIKNDKWDDVDEIIIKMKKSQRQPELEFNPLTHGFAYSMLSISNALLKENNKDRYDEIIKGMKQRSNKKGVK